MLAMSFSAAALAMAMQSPMPAGPDTYQATKALCRPFATSPIHRAPVCRGGGGSRLAPQPVCFCQGPDTKFEEPACWPDGSPAVFKRGAVPTAAQNDKLISCVDWERQQEKRAR